MNTVHVMSYIKWYDVKKCGFDALYSVYDVIHIVDVMLFIQKWVSMDTH